MPLQGHSYEVLLGHGLLANIHEHLLRYAPAAHYALISDSTVASLYAQPLLEKLNRYTPSTLVAFPAGEWNKTRHTWSLLTDRLLGAGVGRDGVVLALGGGVVGDLAGFVAATYMRGIPYVQIPTTLLAMIDSSVGGKTGVDTTYGKNLVGAFYQPAAVLADVETLVSLPRLHLITGMAEALKHGAIADADYYATLIEASDRVCAHDLSALTEIIQRSLEIKVEIVAEDEREHGRRAVLNFGHTMGHALEAVSGYELLHGEAVAIGMVLEASLGERLGITETGTTDQLVKGLERYGLPVNLPDSVKTQRLISIMSLDKKSREKSVRFALLKRLGDVAKGASDSWTHAVSEENMESFFTALT